MGFSKKSPQSSLKKRPFLGLHWKGFLWLSLLLLALSAAFYALNYHYLMSQFRQQRQIEVQSLRQQIEGLLIRTSDRIIRLSGALASLSNLDDLSLEKDISSLEKLSSAIDKTSFASFGYELDIRKIELYTLDARRVWHWPELDDESTDANAMKQKIIAQVRSEERPVTLLACQPSCLLYAFIPILLNGQNVGVMALGQSVADFIIEFRVVTKTDIALVMPAPTQEQSVLPEWSAYIPAQTRSDSMSSLLQKVASLYPHPSDLDHGQMIEWDGSTYDIYRFPLHEIIPTQAGFIVLISNVSTQLETIRQAVNQGIIATVSALGAAELSLLYLVGVPIRRLERFARTLPLVAQGAFKDARDRLLRYRQTAFFQDEIDLLYDSAVQLSHRLEENSYALAVKNKKLAEDHDFIQGLLTTAQVMVLTQTRYGRICSANEFAAQLTGYTAASLCGKSFMDLIADYEGQCEVKTKLEALHSVGAKRMEHEHEIVRNDGERRQVVWVHTSLHEVHTDGTAILSVGIDVTERVKVESRMRWLANHDPLTHLVNRHRFMEELTRALLEAQRTQTTASLLLLDLDYFKEINDTSGHAAGDAMLRMIAEELRTQARQSDIVARLGGDEFAVLMPHTDQYGAEIFARKINTRLRKKPFVYNEKRYRVGASIGVALLPHHGSDIQELMANADLAMYEAKRNGRSRVQLFTYEQEHGEALSKNVYWKDVVARALAHGDLFFHFQPVADVKTGEIIYHEALLRLNMNNKIVMPGEFLTQVERAGLSFDVDCYVVKTALKLLLDNPIQQLSINLSAAALNDDGWFLPLVEAVRDQRLNPQRLIFEITETAAIADMDKARYIAEKISDMGFQFAVDDFGAGFSSLYYLRQLPVSHVKIDRSLVKDLTTDKSDRDFVRAITTMVHAYGKKVVCEGIENAETLNILRKLGVDLAQGYYIGRPQEDCIMNSNEIFASISGHF